MIFLSFEPVPTLPASLINFRVPDFCHLLATLIFTTCRPFVENKGTTRRTWLLFLLRLVFNLSYLGSQIKENSAQTILCRVVRWYVVAHMNVCTFSCWFSFKYSCGVNILLFCSPRNLYRTRNVCTSFVKCYSTRRIHVITYSTHELSYCVYA